jgi:3-dehydroquinate synthase
MSHRILITGGQGFLGRAVAKDWLEQGASVLAIGRSGRNDLTYSHTIDWNGTRVLAPLPKELAEALDNPRYRYESQDINDQAGLCRLLIRYRPTCIIHLAGSLRSSSIDALCSGNIGGVGSLLQAVTGSDWKPDSIILGSSGGIYGIPQELPISEDAPCVPIDPYCASKKAAEDFSRILGKRFNLPIRWARIFNCIGAGQDERHLTSWIALQVAEIKLGLRPPVISIGDLSTTRDYIHARDVASALRTIALQGSDGVAYNVGSGVETSGEAILAAALEAAGLSDFERETKHSRPADIPRHFADMSRLHAIGCTPEIGIKESLEEMISWYENEVHGVTPEIQPVSESNVEFTVSVKNHHSYPVVIQPGLLEDVPNRLRELVPGARLYMVTDTRVWDLLAKDLFERFKAEGFTIDVTVLPEGERSKSLESHLRVTEDMNAAGFQRRSVVLAVGGGVVIDTAAFAASTFMRGVDYINIPTTLLAHHDASVGGKTAVNMPWSKNFVGSFHHPRAAYIDSTVLSTLEDRDIASGIAEAIKVAICGSEPLFSLLENSVEAIRYKRDPVVMSKLVALAAKKKADLLEPDPYEVDLRRVLNLGHTIGHPLETELMYKGLRHGEAVGFGVAVSVAISLARGICSRGAASRIYRLLHSYGLPPYVAPEHVRSIRNHLDSVRRVRGGNLNFVLPTAIDKTVIVQDVTLPEIENALDAVVQEPLLQGDAAS